MALLAWASWAGLAALGREVVAERQALAAALAEHVAYVVRADLEVLQAIRAPATPGTPGAAAGQRLALHDALLRARLLERVLLLGDGATVLAAEPPQAEALARVAGIEEAFRTGRPLATALVDDAPGGPRLYLLVPLRDWHGTVSHVAVGVVNPGGHAFTTLLGGLRPRARESADLIDANGVVLASTEAGRRYARTEQAAVLVGLIAEGQALGAPLRDVAAFAPLPALPWGVAVRQPDPEVSRALAVFRQRLLVAGPAILALALLFAWGAAWSITRPVAVLTAASEHIASGDLTQAIPPVGDDEVGRLGRSLERMRETLRRSHQDLERRVEERTAALQALTRKLSERERWRAQLLRKVISAQEDERKRLARELHDETSQSLAAVTMRIDAALASVGPGPARERLEEAKAVGVRALDELHRLMVDLRPSVLDDLGLASAIRWAVERHLTPRGVTARCEFSGLERRLPPEVETALFRVAQEALVNVARHAEADAVLVQCAARDGEVTIEIEDDGKGFDPAILDAPPDAGAALGLMGMRERVELLGGTIEIESAPGEGTRIALTVRYEPEGGASRPEGRADG
jgi:signal transduction histidine kinase